MCIYGRFGRVVGMVLWGGWIKRMIFTQLAIPLSIIDITYRLCERDGTVGMSTVSLYHESKILSAVILTNGWL